MNQKKKEREQFKVGHYIAMSVSRWGILYWVGQITKVTSRTFSIDWGDNPYNWNTKEIKKGFRNSIRDKDYFQKYIDEWGIMEESTNRFQELGFIISENTKIYEEVEGYPKLKQK